MIHFNQVQKHYGAFKALQDVTFTIRDGMITALIGHNGAGKTTSLRIMVGLVSPDGGSASINGINPQTDGLKARRMISYIPDTPYISPHLTAEEHLRFHADIYKQPEAMVRAHELIQSYKLAKALNRPVKTYSHGMLQRLALIRALMIDTPILILDEPFNALDPIGIQMLTEHLKKRAQAGQIVLVSSHLLAMLENVAQEVVVLKQGHVIYTGSFHEVDWHEQIDEWFGTELDNDSNKFVENTLLVEEEEIVNHE